MDAEFPKRHKPALEAARRDLAALTRPFIPFDAAGGPVNLDASRVGGPIAWPPDREMPMARDGTSLGLALQIDLAGLAPLPGFPSAGLMQLFLADDILERGITFLAEHRKPGDYPLAHGDGFRLVIHDAGQPLVAKAQPASDADYPVLDPAARDKAIALKFGQAEDHIPSESHWLGAAIYQRFEALEDEDDDFDIEAVVEELWGDAPTTCHLGGYAQPLQLDHRAFFQDYRRYDRCLINIQDLPGLELGDLNLSVLINDGDLTSGEFDDVILMADTD